jgi:hypothetical protein
MGYPGWMFPLSSSDAWQWIVRFGVKALAPFKRIADTCNRDDPDPIIADRCIGSA